MKKAIVISLVLALLFQCAAHYCVTILFRMEQKTIAKTLCENRNKPSLKCGGKCYLNKQLNKLENDDKSKSGTVKFEKPELSCILPHVISGVFTVVEVLSKPFNPMFQHMIHRIHSSTLLRPPIYL